jgi:hypothetical protein
MTNSGKVVANAGVANAKSQYTNAVALPKDLFTAGESKSQFANSAAMPTLGSNSTSTPPPLGNAATAPTQSGGKRKGAKKVTKKGKKGGALMDDVKNLAVPFAILLAKQGLQTMFDKKKKTSTGSELSARSAASATSSRRKSTLTGGSCGSQCAAHVAPATGGAKRTASRSTASKSTASKTTASKASGTRASSSRSSRGGAQGQQVKSRFEKLSKEIDEFLQKY